MDIKFLRELKQYKETNESIAKVAIAKFVNHLYYLTDECVTFALFDESINEDTKLKMAQTILETAENDTRTILKKFPLKKEEISEFLQSSDDEILIKLLSNTRYIYFADSK